MTSAFPKRRLSPERRRALELLASSGGGANAALLVHIHGFKRHVRAGLFRRKLAAAEREVAMVRDGGRGGAHPDYGGWTAGDRGMKANRS
jgi:hypothetical protein